MGIIVAFDGDWLKLMNNNHLAVFSVAVIVYNTKFDSKFVKNTIKIIKITVIVAAVVSIVQVFDSSFMNPILYKRPERAFLMDDIYRFRRTSIFGFIEINAVGLAFLPLLSVLIGYMLQKKERGYLLYLLLGAVVALLSNSRYIMAGIIIISFQILVFNKAQLRGLVVYTMVGVIAYFVLTKVLLLLGYDFQEWYDTRLLAEGALTETTRFKAIGTFIKFFPQKPLFGTGIMTKEIVDESHEVGSSHIHVGYLSHLVMYGIVGCFFLFGFWLLLLKRLYKTAKYTQYWGSFFAYLVFFFAFATMSQPSTFYYGLIFALVFDKYFFDRLKTKYLEEHGG